ncbi:hypothetical protein [Bacillus suaedaesalsae]|uniref:YtzI protein n=1 Tax=Bacillus suaedaesalsae TaxID=2810349 RepID=A0ABS2DG33_9BACI|nr:hypothetical protein [Bacillus suaedaesalsae]MBM6616496.1 hypothetical protein [Bacillus suaedaesalsae]
MLELWLTLGGICLIFFLGLGVFFYSIKSSLEPNDSESIDPLPEEVE